MFLDPETTPGFKRSLFNAIVAPRPIGWISSLSATGEANLAPFSHFNLVSTAPPVLIFSCNAAGDRLEKDTLANVRASKEFVANLVTWELRDAMNQTSLNVPSGTDEFALAGLEKLPSVKVRPPRVAASPAHLECTLLQIVEIEPTRPGETRSSVVFGRVVGVHLDDAFVTPQGHFDVARTRPLTRLGGSQYSSVGELVELSRPSPAHD
ncbi:Flavin reductase like domain protein [Pigmentiphaga humi]|uniref:Flavin reductase like domain protein n=1 Tax=Pigmentiphaga humi TaxID=2478468 RepID=A0A3P4B0C2_9BURK|nr:flavin reductase family protein [Pigmentiphaga humi]VCU68565.1 Flavin reductase like domain protein [Pigmentiphaga humi]